MVNELDVAVEALRKIAEFQTPEQIRETDIGLSYEEHLQMAYENIIEVAVSALETIGDR